MNAAADWLNASQLPAIAADAQRLADTLQAQGSLPTVNYCGHRYHFWVALFASLLAGSRALLPPSSERRAAERILPGQEKQLLDDDLVAGYCRYSESADASTLLAAAREAESFVTVFTSGSTGSPKPINKSWQQLADRAASYLGNVFAAGSHIVAMVPQQHMYGLETSLFTSLLEGFQVHGHSAAYPASAAAALEASSQPAMLVTTPSLLQLLLKANVELPNLAGIVSATSPLGSGLKQQVEQRYGCSVTEIYGFSEAGSVAWRRADPVWQLLPGLTAKPLATPDGEHVGIYSEEGLLATVEDTVELIDEHRLLLKGRPADLVKIGGKRASLAGLTQQLMQLPSVQDGHISYCSESEQLVAFVVTGSRPREVRRAMADVCDLSFVPRKIHAVEAIPRSASGKVTAEGLAELQAQVEK